MIANNLQSIVVHHNTQFNTFYIEVLYNYYSALNICKKVLLLSIIKKFN